MRVNLSVPFHQSINMDICANYEVKLVDSGLGKVLNFEAVDSHKVPCGCGAAVGGTFSLPIWTRYRVALVPSAMFGGFEFKLEPVQGGVEKCPQCDGPPTLVPEPASPQPSTSQVPSTTQPIITSPLSDVTNRQGVNKKRRRREEGGTENCSPQKFHQQKKVPKKKESPPISIENLLHDLGIPQEL